MNAKDAAKAKKHRTTIAAEAGIFKASDSPKPPTTEKTATAAEAATAVRKLEATWSPAAAGMTIRAATSRIPATFIPRTMVTAVRTMSRVSSRPTLTPEARADSLSKVMIEELPVVQPDGRENGRRQDHREPDLERLDGQDVPEKVGHELDVEVLGQGGQQDADGHAQAAEDADGRVAVQAGPVLELHDGDGRRDGDQEGRGERQDAEEQPERDPGEGDVRQAVADHGVLAQDEEDAEHRAGDCDQDAGKDGPLEESVGEKGLHGALSARARRGGRPG